MAPEEPNSEGSGGEDSAGVESTHMEGGKCA